MTIEQELRKKYETYRKKYSLPSFDDLDSEFGIVLLADGRKELVGELLVAIRHKIVDTLNVWVNYLHSLYIPVPNYLVSMKEHEGLSEDDHKKIYVTIAKLSLLIRKSFKISLYWKNAEKDAGFIKESFNEFRKMKDDIGYFIDNNIKIWSKILKD